MENILVDFIDVDDDRYGETHMSMSVLIEKNFKNILREISLPALLYIIGNPECYTSFEDKLILFDDLQCLSSVEKYFYTEDTLFRGPYGKRIRKLRYPKHVNELEKFKLIRSFSDDNNLEKEWFLSPKVNYFKDYIVSTIYNIHLNKILKNNILLKNFELRDFGWEQHTQNSYGDAIVLGSKGNMPNIIVYCPINKIFDFQFFRLQQNLNFTISMEDDVQEVFSLQREYVNIYQAQLKDCESIMSEIKKLNLPSIESVIIEEYHRLK